MQAQTIDANANGLDADALEIEAREIALALGRDVRTVRRVQRGGGVRGLCGAQIRQAIAQRRRGPPTGAPVTGSTSAARAPGSPANTERG